MTTRMRTKRPYLHKPMFGECYTYNRSSLRKPPFEGEFEAM